MQYPESCILSTQLCGGTTSEWDETELFLCSKKGTIVLTVIDIVPPLDASSIRKLHPLNVLVVTSFGRKPGERESEEQRRTTFAFQPWDIKDNPAKIFWGFMSEFWGVRGTNTWTEGGSNPGRRKLCSVLSVIPFHAQYGLCLQRLLSHLEPLLTWIVSSRIWWPRVMVRPKWNDAGGVFAHCLAHSQETRRLLGPWSW